MSLPDLLLLSEYGCHPLAQDTRIQHLRITLIARGLQFESDNLNALPKQMRDATNRLRFVHFQVGDEDTYFIQILLFFRDYTFQKKNVKNDMRHGYMYERYHTRVIKNHFNMNTLMQKSRNSCFHN